VRQRINFALSQLAEQPVCSGLKWTENQIAMLCDVYDSTIDNTDRSVQNLKTKQKPLIADILRASENIQRKDNKNCQSQLIILAA
jgi:Na+/phosphate symporter